MGRPLGAEIPSSDREREALAKIWLLRMIERTPLADVPQLPLEWVAREAPALVAEVAARLAGEAGGTQLAAAARARMVELAAGRLEAGLLARELAALQAVMVEDLHRRALEPQGAEFATRMARLAELFGVLQAMLTEAALGRGEFEGPTDTLTGLPGAERLEELLRDVEAEHRLGGEPFSVVRIGVEGLDHVNAAHGEEAGDDVLVELTAAMRSVEQAGAQPFRLTRDEFCVLLPGTGARVARRYARRLADALGGALAEGRRGGVAIGVAACPDHANDAEELLEAAEEATFAALAAGVPVAVAGERPR